MKDIAPSLPGQPRPPQADISKLIAAMWKNEQPEVRQHYEALSDMKKAEHLALYPGYRFQPMKKADREKARAEKRAEKEREKMAAMALKNYRKPKSKRGVTEESVDLQSPITPQPMAALPWQIQMPVPGPVPATVSSPTTAPREHTFAYQPYATPSAPTAAPAKRKRAKTKVEAQAPVLPAEEPQAGSLFITSFCLLTIHSAAAAAAAGVHLFSSACLQSILRSQRSRLCVLPRNYTIRYSAALFHRQYQFLAYPAV
jgi:hypothetical protein